ncbi:FecR family protein [Butyrivibrio sp. FC2001]|uniref:FecR family protein n=1 Tax=Butyrivibrio sp. FC2001 TaxID=1280671 RepID=UPI00041DD0CE|nr:FecR family protein [Butyrivibrio sp. FC2001]
MRGEKSYHDICFISAGRRFILIALVLFVFISYAKVDVNAAEVKTDAANIMRMEKYEGTVGVSDDKGKAISVMEKMRLNDGNQISTKKKSYAYISLDDTKAVKLDAESSLEVRKTGTKYEALLDSGNLFFNVSEPLTDDEEFNIKTSSMTMGIRGTCAQIEDIDAEHTKVCLLEGSLQCSMKNIATGEEKTVMLIAGQAADFYSSGLRVETSEVSISDLKGFALLELYNDKELTEKIFQQSGLDFRKLSYETVTARLKKDQGKAGSRLAKTNGKSNKKPNSNPGNNLDNRIYQLPIAYDQPSESPSNGNDQENNSNPGDSQTNGNNNSSSDSSKKSKKKNKKNKKKKEDNKKDEGNKDDGNKDDGNKDDEKKDDDKKDKIESPSASAYQH